MSANVRVALHASPRPWRQDFFTHVANHAVDIHLEVVREARSALEIGPAVIVADESARWLDVALMGTLRRQHVAVIVVSGGHPSSERSLSPVARAADAVVSDDAGPEAILAAVQSVAAVNTAPTEPDPLSTWAPVSTRPAAEEATAPAAPLALGAHRPALTSGPGEPRSGGERRGGHRGGFTEPPDGPKGGEGEITLLTGPPAAAVHEVAVALAAALAARAPTVVVDVDLTQPRLARRLGYDLTPNLLGALERQRSGRGWPGDVTRVARRAGGPPVRFHAVVGVPPGETVDINQAEISALLATLQVTWNELLVVTDGPRLGVRPAPARRLLVGPPGRLGVLETLDWLAEFGSPAGDAAPWTVLLTGAPADPSTRAQLQAQLMEHTPPGLVYQVRCLPADRRVAEAEWHGELVGRGPFYTTVEEFAAEMRPVVAAGRPVHRRRSGR